MDDFHCGGCDQVCPVGQNCSVNGCCWQTGIGGPIACTNPGCRDPAAIRHPEKGCCLNAGGSCEDNADCCSGSCADDHHCAEAS